MIRPIIGIDIHERLELSVKLIDVLAGRRLASGDVNLGSNIERMIIERELEELEDDIYREPGPLASFLPPRGHPLETDE